MPQSLEQYLYNRGLKLDASDVGSDKDIILDDNELLAQAAGLKQDSEKILTMIIQNRINKIGNELLLKAIPQEMTVLRQAIVEVAKILEDIEIYAIEYRKRKEGADNTSSEEDEPTPPPEEEVKSSL